MNKYPKISVVVATYNSKNTIEKCLASVRNQLYPQENIELIIIDGSSKDNTFELIKKYNVRFYSVPKNRQNAEYNKGIGISHAKGELLLLIDHDNVLPHKKWLEKMILPLITDKKIVGVETLRYHYDKNGSLLDRYFALFGAGDPLAFYLGKSDRLSFMYKKYNLLGNILQQNPYYVVEFDKKHVPTIGANGFLIRRKLLLENAKADPDNYFHIDVNVDLIKKGFNRYAFINDDIIHLTGYKSVTNFLFRRALFMQQYYIKASKRRRYSVYMPEDNFGLVKFVFYSVTIVKPLVDSIRGYISVQDNAWFLHPILCFSLTVIYTVLTVRNNIVANAK